jgi:N-methylhydantoinase B
MRETARVDAVQLEVVGHALVAVAEEMSVTVWRTSRSTTVRELLDYSTAVFDRLGRNVAQSARMPVHINSMEPCLQAILSGPLPLDKWCDGDVVVTNDPYSGGQHLPDFLTFKPVFVNEQLVGITGVLIHHVDVGGGAAGGYYANATEIYQEGLRVPPLKIVVAGALQNDLLRTFMQNVREPETFRGDFLSQLAALEVGARSLRALAVKYGTDTVADVSDLVINHAERSMRSAIAKMPDGHYEGEAWLDGDGIVQERKRIHVRMSIAGECIVFDLSQSSPQTLGPINCTTASTHSAIYYAAIAAAEITNANSGCYLPITIISPKGLITNASFPAPVSMRMVTAHRIAIATLRAFASALPDRIPATYYGVTFNHALNIISRDGKRQVYFDSEIGGWGAHPDRDGPSALSAGLHNIQNTPIEMIEALYPIRFLRYGLVADSGGAGRKRGGLGLVREWRFLGERGQFNASFDGFQTQALGLQGGGAGRAGRLLISSDDVTREMPSKVSGYELKSGDIITMETPGGGGHGFAHLRDREELLRDILDGYVTEIK